MTPDTRAGCAFHLKSPSGLEARILANGTPQRIDCGSTTLTLFVANEIEGGAGNLYLRRRSGERAWTALLGPRSPTRFRVSANRLFGVGHWQGLDYTLALVLAETQTTWFWQVELHNATSVDTSVDLTYAQDIALASYGGIRLNEYYISQYLDHTALQHPERGVVVASRQNLAMDGRHPWALTGSIRHARSFATDARQLHGLASRAGRDPIGLTGELPSKRLQHEHAMVVLRDEPITIRPGERAHAGFFFAYVADHPRATEASDLERVPAILSVPEATWSAPTNSPVAPAASAGAACPSYPNATLFSTAPLLAARDLDPATLAEHLPAPHRHVESAADGTLAFFRSDDAHVVLRAKELEVLRPHGHILRTGRHLTPDESALTSTVWMAGVFHSMLTQGHVAINRFLSTVHTYLGLFRSHGLRVFVRMDDTWQLLDVPSAFEMTPAACRWWYAHARGLIEVRSAAVSEPNEMTLSIRVLSGERAQFLICHHVAINGDDGNAPGGLDWQHDDARIRVSTKPDTELGGRFPHGTFEILPLDDARWEKVGGDEMLFLDGRSRQQPFLCVLTSPSDITGLRIRGHLVEGSEPAPRLVPASQPLIPRLPLGCPDSGLAIEVAALAEIVPWLTHDALVHYLSPRGLEQYSGGGWGTRDVCQGPVELLLSQQRIEPIRDILRHLFTNQNPAGDWPQWFMFFDRERNIRAGDAHGDVIFWPLLVLAQYLDASGDAAFLEESLPYFDPRGEQHATHSPVREHVERALALIAKQTIPGTHLAAYGHGDWNDSLQPADPAMRERLCSAWTVTLHFQVLRALANAYTSIGLEKRSQQLEQAADAVRSDFQRLLHVDGVVAGYALFDGGADKVDYLLHPRDTRTGVHYSSLAMIHAILEDLLTPEQARHHIGIIDAHLVAPDGVRLFDRPMPYHGGVEHLFQRAETATFWGREIGLMYMHAHLRYAQALAHMGEAERFFRALQQANPIRIGTVVQTATARQSNCYYSSSDAQFADRKEASAEYERVRTGRIAFDGGWRVYSSGAGIALGLIVRRLLGWSLEAHALEVDPVLPPRLDGLVFETQVLEKPLTVEYRVGPSGCGVEQLLLNDSKLPFELQPNPHRRGAARVALAAIEPRLTERNRLVIHVGR